MDKTFEITSESLISQKEGNIVSDMDGEKVMLSIENGKYYNLGQIGGVIWDLLTEPIMYQQIVEKLVNQYDVDRKQCEAQVLSFLQSLEKERLIQVSISE